MWAGRRAWVGSRLPADAAGGDVWFDTWPALHLLDLERILAGDETEPVTRLTYDEAQMAANWFGKVVADQEIWQAVARTLGAAEFGALWGPSRKEWAGSRDEDLRIAVSAATYGDDPEDELESASPRADGDRLVYGEYETSAAIGLRTAVSAPIGLLDRLTSRPWSLADVEVVAPLDRSS